MKYPVRCKIVDVYGGMFHGLPIATPNISKSHVGKFGVAYKTKKRGSVRIKLDDGTLLWGYECWWIPISLDSY